jgi:hypothetical protein
MAREFTLRCRKCKTRLAPGQLTCHGCFADLTVPDAIHSERDDWRESYEKGFVQFVLLDPLALHLLIAAGAALTGLWLNGGAFHTREFCTHFASGLTTSVVICSLRWREFEKEFEEPADSQVDSGL